MKGMKLNPLYMFFAWTLMLLFNIVPESLVHDLTVVLAAFYVGFNLRDIPETEPSISLFVPHMSEKHGV